MAYWEDLDKNMAYSHGEQYDWLIQFLDNQYNDSRYISVTNDNTRFTLTRAGYYKLTLIACLDSVSDGYEYALKLLKNGVWDNYIHRYDALSGSPSYYFMTCSIMVHSDGNDFFEINAKCDLTDNFYFASGQANDMLSIEYFL